MPGTLQERQEEFDVECEDYDVHNKPARVSPPPVAPPTHVPELERMYKLSMSDSKTPNKKFGPRRREEKEFGPEL